MTQSVVVTRIGPVSAIGEGRDAFFAALTAGTPGFGPITLCDASASPSTIATVVNDFRLDRYVVHGEVMARRTPRSVQLVLAAGVLALHDAEIDLDACDPDRLGVFVGTSIGNLDTALSLKERLSALGTIPPRAAFHAFSHSAACVLSSFFNIRGPVHTTTSGCNSGVDALGQAMRLIQSGAVDMLVVGTDCEVVSEVLAALNASGSLSLRWNDNPSRASRLFDAQRDGNVIGEGADGLLLESEAQAARRGARQYARMTGYQVCSAGKNRQYSHDHPELDTRPSVRAMRGAIREAGWSPEQVDAINANGSSSVLYHRLEAAAIREALGAAGATVRVHSQKSMLGQHGAGSSALQAVGACLSIRRGIVPGTINHDDPDPACIPLRVVTQSEHSMPNRVLMHSIGLGGFYYSAAAFEAPRLSGGGDTGLLQVRWSEGHNPKFAPADAYQRPLVPWSPRSERRAAGPFE